MLNKIFKYAFCALVGLVVASCSKSDDATPPFEWGEYEYYDDFLWVKTKTDTLTHTLAFDFNDDAQKDSNVRVRLGVFEKNEVGEMTLLEPSKARFLLDGKEVAADGIEVRSDRSEAELGIIVSPAAPNEMLCWYLKVVESDSLQRINDEALEDDTAPVLQALQIDKHRVYNPLAFGLFVAMCVIVACLLIWLLLIKPMAYPKFKVGQIQLWDPAPYMETRRLKNARRLVLTNKPTKQSFLNEFFTGKVVYAVNPLWDAPIVFTPDKKRTVRIHAPNNYYVTSLKMQRLQEYEIENTNTKAKTKIQIN